MAKMTLWELQGFGTPFSGEAIKNMSQVETQIYLYLEELIVNRYSYKNLPKGLEDFLIEDLLFWKGSGIAFKYPGTETIMLLPVTQGGDLNVYSRMQYGTPLSANGVEFPYSLRMLEDLTGNEKQEAVFWMNNLKMTPTCTVIKPFVDQFIYILQSKVMNCAMARKPVIIKGNKKTAAALNQQFTSIFGNGINPFKVSYDDGDLKSMLEVLNLGIKYDQQAYWDDLKNTWNWILTLCGIKNDENVAKKERVVVDQIQSNEENVFYSKMNTFKYRQKAVEEMNKVFNLNIEVVDKHEEEKKQEQEMMQKALLGSEAKEDNNND